MNGLPTLHFDGVDDNLEVASNRRINDLNNFNIFIVFSVYDTGNTTEYGKGIITKLPGTSLTTGTTITYPPYVMQYAVDSMFMAQVNGDDASMASSGYYVFGPRFATTMFATLSQNSDTEILKLYVDGDLKKSISSTDSVANVASALKIAQQNGSSTRFSKCDISEIIIFSRDLKTRERQSVESYLAQKWGVIIDS